MKKESIHKLIVASILACTASVSQATSVDTWNYSIEMSWTHAVFSSSNDANASTKFGSTLLSWGYKDGADDALFGYGAEPSAVRSSLNITDPKGTGTIFTDSSVSKVNMFRHTNNAINSTYPALTEATLSVVINLTPNGGTKPITLSKDFDIFFWETPNTGGTCMWGPCSNDLFAFASLPQIYEDFVYDGITYRFEYFQTSGPGAIQEFSAAVCGQISGGKLTTSCFGFQTAEHANTTLQFGFSVSSIPEPGTYAMLLAGLGLVGVVVRRRRSIYN